jgi:CO/xanthine dehydrogenase Mo-binding subunit
MDELAQEAGIDPFEFRMLNSNEPDEITPMGLKVSTCGLKECLETVARKLDWKKKHTKGKYTGKGMASLIHVGGGARIYRSDASGLILKLDDFGNVNVYHGGVEMGQGLHSVLTLAVSEALGVKPEKVLINPTDTGTCPWDVGTHASRGTFMACNTAILAANKLRSQIFELAEELFPEEAEKNLKKYMKKNPGYKPPDFDVHKAARRERFELRDGFVFIKDGPQEPWLRIELGKLLRAIHFRTQGQMLTTEVFYDPPNELPDFEKGFGNISATYAYGTQGAEVEVDTETGEVKILRMVAAHDVGKVLNPLALKGQIYGALAQGVGYALYEKLQSHQGKILNPNFRDYKITTVQEMNFPIDLEFIETDDSYGPFGAKGVAEPGLVPTAPAIANAIYDAVGVRIRDLPITPEKILAALNQSKKEK